MSRSTMFSPSTSSTKASTFPKLIKSSCFVPRKVPSSSCNKSAAACASTSQRNTWSYWTSSENTTITFSFRWRSRGIAPTTKTTCAAWSPPARKFCPVLRAFTLMPSRASASTRQSTRRALTPCQAYAKPIDCLNSSSDAFRQFSTSMCTA